MNNIYISTLIFVVLLFSRSLVFASDYKSLNKQGLEQYNKKDYRKAKELFIEAIKLYPNFTEAELNLTVTLIHLEEYETAIKNSHRLFKAIKSNYKKSDAYFNGKKACELITPKKQNEICMWVYRRSEIIIYYNALLEKPSKSKYDLLEKAIADALIDSGAASNYYLSEIDLAKLKNGDLPDSGNGVVGFDDNGGEMLIFVHDSDIKYNTPSVAVFNSNGSVFLTIETKEIYPGSGTYMGSKDFGQLMSHGTYNIAFYVDQTISDGVLKSYKKIFYAH